MTGMHGSLLRQSSVLCSDVGDLPFQHDVIDAWSHHLIESQMFISIVFMRLFARLAGKTKRRRAAVGCSRSAETRRSGDRETTKEVMIPRPKDEDF